MPVHTKPSAHMTTNLGTKSEHEPALRQLLQRPRRHSRNRRAARKRHSDRRADSDRRGRGCPQGEQLIRVILGLFNQDRIDAELLSLSCTSCEVSNVQGRLGFSQTWIEFAQRKQCLYQHLTMLTAAAISPLIEPLGLHPRSSDKIKT
jgi:hypothetical protein